VCGSYRDTRRPSMTLTGVPDGKELASFVPITEVCLWEVEGRNRLVCLRGHHVTRVRAWALRPDGRLLATSGRDRSIRLWDPTTGTFAQIPVGPSTTPTPTFLLGVA